jgi:hypothetical protein
MLLLLLCEPTLHTLLLCCQLVLLDACEVQEACPQLIAVLYTPHLDMLLVTTANLVDVVYSIVNVAASLFLMPVKCNNSSAVDGSSFRGVAYHRSTL